MEGSARGTTPAGRMLAAECRQPPGKVAPIIDRGKCEGRAACVAVCPCRVFVVGRIDDGDFQALSWLGRLKSRAHGRQTAYTPRAAACEGCRRCVAACPEKAIRMGPYTAG